MSPRLPVTSAAATAPFGPPMAPAMRSVSVLRALSMATPARAVNGTKTGATISGRETTIAHGADLPEIGVAREVVAAGHGRGGRRRQPHRGGDARAGFEGGSAAHVDAHAHRRAIGGEAVDRADPQQEPRALAAQVDGLHVGRDARDRLPLEHRRRHAHRPHGARGEAREQERARKRSPHVAARSFARARNASAKSAMQARSAGHNGGSRCAEK